MTKKEIVYSNPAEFIFLLIINCGLVVACIWKGNIWGLLFFGVCALYVAYPLLDPRKKVVFVGTKAYKKQPAKEFSNRLVDHGIFRYNQNGFSISLSPSKDINWSDIQSIFVSKVDLIAIDEICMDVFCDHEISFRVTEETPGWYVFLERLQERFPTIEKDWTIKVMHPAFETNLTRFMIVRTERKSRFSRSFITKASASF